MAATSSPPPPPPPPPCLLRPHPPPRRDPVPTPCHAALPYFPNPPVQETSPSAQAVPENGAGTVSQQSGPESEARFPSSSADGDGHRCGGAPVQETEPAAQVMQQQEAASKQMDPPADEKKP